MSYIVILMTFTAISPSIGYDLTEENTLTGPSEINSTNADRNFEV